MIEHNRIIVHIFMPIYEIIKSFTRPILSNIYRIYTFLLIKIKEVQNMKNEG